ncbi:Regulator of chromosome condensation (RCC1) repeat family protein [Brugia pahangi]
MSEECKIFAAYFGTIEVRRSATKSRVILRNYLQQRVSQFQIDGQIKDVSHTHNYIFALAPSDHRIYTLRIDSFFVYSLNLDMVPENPKFEYLVNVNVETELMHDRVDFNDPRIPEMAHCDMQPKETIKTKVEDFLICTTSHSCYLARNRVSGEPSLYRIFTDNKTDDFQVLQFGSEEPILQLSAGNEHVLILTVSGLVYSMGIGSRGVLGHANLRCEQHPKQVECLSPLRVTQVACGKWHSAALTEDGDVYLWGWNNFGQLGDCCEVGEILDIPTPLDILEIIVQISAYGNATWLKRSDHWELTFGSTKMF